MKFRSVILASALIGFLGAAQAHTHLKKSVPQEKSVLTVAPSNVLLQFAQPVRLTAVTLEKDGEKEVRKLGPLPKDAAAEFTLPVEALGAGAYTVNWRIVGGDNHVMAGALHFSVAPGK